MKKLLLSILSVAGLAGGVSAQCTITSAPTNNCTYGDAINSFVLNGVASTGNSGCGGSGYNSFTSPVRTLTLGGVYAWSATVGGGSYTQNIGIWIDLNNDGNYVASEQVVQTQSAQLSHTGTLSIPFSAVVANNISMRVRCVYSGLAGANDACTNNLGSYGETEDYKINIVCPGPSAITVVSTNTYICLGQSTTLTASGAQVLTWTGGITNGVGFTPSGTTSYTVTGSVASCPSSSGTAVRTISVATTPLPISANTTNTNLCEGSTATLTASGAANYTWMPGNTTNSSVVVNPSATTVYTIVGYNGSGCPGTVNLPITVTPLPVITTAGSAAKICEGASASFTASGAQSYTWIPGNIVAQSITVSPISSQGYNILGTGPTGCVGSTGTVVLVSAKPTVNASTNKSIICNGASVLLTASGTDSYSWVNGPTTNTASMNPTTSTTFSVIGTNTTTGCSNLVTVNVNVFTPTVTASPNSAICLESAITLTASGGNSYIWTPGGNGSEITITPTVTGAYVLTVNSMSSNLTCTTTKTVNVTVNAKPSVVAAATRTSICIGETTTLSATGASSYSWSTKQTDVSFVYTGTTAAPIYITVVGTDNNNCSNLSTVLLKVNSCTGINELNSNTAISVFPNPSSGMITIQSAKDLDLQLINELGQHVKTINLTGMNDYKLNVDNLANGIYFLVGNSVNQKIVVAK